MIITAASVKALRQRLGLSQKSLGLLVGASPGTVRNWEKGLRQPRKPQAQRLIQLDEQDLGAEALPLITTRAQARQLTETICWAIDNHVPVVLGDK